MNNQNNQNNQNSTKYEYEFKDGFVVYKNSDDLDWRSLIAPSGENLEYVDENRLTREINIRVDNNQLALTIMKWFMSNGVKIENTVIGNGVGKGCNGILPNKVIMYISVPENNEDLGITGQQLAKWFTWVMTKIRCLPEYDSNNRSLGYRIDYLIKDNSINDNMKLSDRINNMIGFGDSEVRNKIEIRSKIREGEFWTGQYKENFYLSQIINEFVTGKFKKVYGDKTQDILNELHEYGEWMKQHGFKVNGFNIMNIFDEDNDEYNEYNEDEDKFGSFDVINKRFEDVQDEIDMDSWSDEEKEYFNKINKRINEITLRLMGNNESESEDT